VKTDLLLKLADLLEADANNPHGVRFNLGTWITTSKGSAPEMSCGTQACAMGLAAISGIFKDEGLTYRRFAGSQLIPVLTKNGDFFEGFVAATNLFEFPDNGPWPSYSSLLFDPEYYPTEGKAGREAELKVADRIRKLVNDGKLSFNEETKKVL
jgi:hypothetical protein